MPKGVKTAKAVKAVGETIRKWREHAGLTGEELGALCPKPLARSGISDLEGSRGKTAPRVDTVLNIIGGIEKWRKRRLGRTDALRLARFFGGPTRDEAQNLLESAARNILKIRGRP